MCIGLYVVGFLDPGAGNGFSLATNVVFVVVVVLVVIGFSKY